VIKYRIKLFAINLFGELLTISNSFFKALMNFFTFPMKKFHVIFVQKTFNKIHYVFCMLNFAINHTEITRL